MPYNSKEQSNIMFSISLVGRALAWDLELAFVSSFATGLLNDPGHIALCLSLPICQMEIIMLTAFIKPFKT